VQRRFYDGLRRLILPASLCAGLAWCAPTIGQPAFPDDNVPYTGIPGSPTTPFDESRPEGWPNGVPLPRKPGPVPGEAQLIENATTIARVGTEVILAGEVMGNVNETLIRNADKIPPEQLEEYRKVLTQRTLTSLIERKLVYQDARRRIPGENLPKIEEQVGEIFESSEVKRLIKGYEVNSRNDLVAILKRYGTSIDHEKRSFIEQQVAQQWLHNQIKPDEEITREQRLKYYNDNIERYEHPDRVRWEELMVRTRSDEDPASARTRLARMGNRVIDGEPFAEVARTESDGLTAADGGLHDWVTRGSLASATLDEALFSLPPGGLSPIIETERGLHIVRVIEREYAGRTPFVDVQSEIRDRIKNERFREQTQEYIAKLREQTPIWTIFDDQPQPTSPREAAQREATARQPKANGSQSGLSR